MASSFRTSVPEDAILFGAHKRPRPEDYDIEAIRKRSLNMLARCLNLHTTVAVIGSGCSVSLGYPTWSDFARGLLEATSEFLKDSGASRQRQQIVEMRCQLRSNRGRVEPESLMYFIGTCKRVLLGGRPFSRAQGRGKEVFRAFFNEHFSPARRQDPGPGRNPYEELRRLPIRRFVTTNYDEEIKRAFEQAGHQVQTFTQVDEEVQELTRFAVAELSDLERPAILHCHGRHDQPRSIVAGESDYQRWYLGQEASDGTAFRQSLELLFESNPLLFVAMA